jgi:prevent-host-death family protein
MRGKTVDVEDAKTHLSRLIARVERGERIIIARAGKPVAQLRPVRKMKKRSVPLDDPLLRVHEYRYDGPIGSTANQDIDTTVCDV